MKLLLAMMVLLAFGCAGHATEIRIALLGDSTVATYDQGPREFYGWGHFLREELGPGYLVFNYAKAGRSSKSFWNEGRVPPAMKERPDIVIVQFGHNDQPGKGAKLETNPNDTYRDQLRLYLEVVRKSGAKPVLVTPVVRRIFLPDGRVDNSLLRPYAEAMLAVAAEEKVPCFDLNAESEALFHAMGPEKTAAFGPPQNPKDLTHFGVEGARTIAGMVAGFLRRTLPETFGTRPGI